MSRLMAAIGGSLSYNDHALVEFTILRDMGQVKTTVRMLNCRRADFQLFKELMTRTAKKLQSEVKALNRAGSS